MLNPIERVSMLPLDDRLATSALAAVD